MPSPNMQVKYEPQDGMDTGNTHSSSVSCFTCSTAEQHSKNHQKTMATSICRSRMESDMMSTHVSCDDLCIYRLRNRDIGSSCQRNAVCGDSELLEPQALTNIGFGSQIGCLGLEIGWGRPLS